MSCPTEAVLAVYADGELPPEEARRTEAHIAACPRCQPLVEALHGESRLLTRLLDEAVATEPAEAETSWADRVTALLVVVAAGAGIQALWRWLGTLGEQTSVSIVDTRSLMVSALFEAVFYLLREGASMLTSFMTVLGLFFFAAGFVGLWYWRRRTAGVMVLTALVALAASSASALERRVVKDGNVTIPADETIDDSVFAAGETVSVDGIITGNLLVCARRVSVRGTVKGDLVALGQRIELDGKVEGNVVTAGEELAVRGPIGRSLHAFVKHAGIDREAKIEWDSITFAQAADLEGQVGRDLLVFAGITNLRGDVARHASAWTGHLKVEGPVKIGGDFTAHTADKDHLNVDSRVTVVGKTETHFESDKPKGSGKGSRYASPSFYVWKTVWLAAAFLTGLVLSRLWPSFFAYRLGNTSSILKPLGIGFLVLVAAPIGILLLGVTLVGLPLALLLLALWIASLYLSGIVVGGIAGRALLERRGAVPPPPFPLALIVGLLVVAVAASIPYLGGLVRFCVLLLGLGIATVQAARTWRGTATPSVSP
jgi:anti-sigma factor RsiW